jgi:hypothetical protein
MEACVSFSTTCRVVHQHDLIIEYTCLYGGVPAWEQREFARPKLGGKTQKVGCKAFMRVRVPLNHALNVPGLLTKTELAKVQKAGMLSIFLMATALARTTS